jgi:hypothetical protein
MFRNTLVATPDDWATYFDVAEIRAVAGAPFAIIGKYVS